jgi:23S rRNA pseudouridine1911/1915/1917 synthase
LANTKTLLDDVRRLFGPEANLVHRLDRETSGVVIASKNRFAEREFKTSFQRREVEKEYLAVVRGKIERPLRISAPLEANRDPAIKVKMVVSPTGREAITDLVPLENWGEFTLVKLRPLTGRQHQLRVHLAHIGHPIVGDPLYGVPVEVGEAYLDKKLSPTERLRWCLAPRLLLHAYKIGFRFFGNRYKLISPTDFKREAKRILGIEK